MAEEDPRPRAQGLSLATVGILAALLLVPAYGAFEWFFCRIEPDSDKVVVVIAKTGTNPPSDRVIAGEGEKGIRLEVLKPGARYFLNPLFYDWEEVPLRDVPPGHVGVLVRKFGKTPDTHAFEQGNFVVAAGSEVKGIVSEVLQPGKHAINPYAYDLEVAPFVEVPTGFVGVVTNLVGEPHKANGEYTSAPGERGVQKETYGPGVYYLNPYEKRVDNVDVRTKRFEFAAADKGDHERLTFFSSDGFEIEVHLTTTWRIDPARAPEVLARLATLADAAKLEEEIIHKVLTPAIRGFARIEGSKFPAIDYIGGTSRHIFQAALLEKLKEACSPFGIVIHEILVNDIEPPQEIATPIREREIAKEELARNKNQIQQAIAEQSLARQTAMVTQEKARVEAETTRIQKTIVAKNLQEVAVIDQDRQLEVAKTDLVSAKAQAAAIVARGEADADVIRAQNEAEAEPLRQSVAAFKSGADFAAYTFSRKIAPAISGVFADPSGPFGQMFTDCLDAASKEAAAKKAAEKAGER
ncbi:hypothetical protein HY251_11000 [bacterium]|nr:hypothetical protein [bacterium]